MKPRHLPMHLLLVAVTLPLGSWAASPGPTSQDVRKGEAVYSRCVACHTLQHDMVGPRHCGLFGRTAGAVAGFDYSPAMRASRIVWNEKTLDRFLSDPMKAIPGTSMTYSGIPDRDERAALIAWLKQASGSIACTSGAGRQGG